MRFLLHMISSIMKFITINCGFFCKLIVLPLPFWLWTSNETQRSFEIYNNPSTGAASKYSLGKEKPKMSTSWPSWLCLVRRPYLLNYMSNSTEILCVDRFEAGLGTGQISAQSDDKRLRSRVFHLTFTCFIRRSKGCIHCVEFLWVTFMEVSKCFCHKTFHRVLEQEKRE